MLVCRKGSNGKGAERRNEDARRAQAPRKLGEGGPVFLPRRKPSALGEALLAATDRVTAYDDIWFAGRPLT